MTEGWGGYKSNQAPLILCTVGNEFGSCSASACRCVILHLVPCRYRTFVSEDAGPNTLVATVLAKDPDGDGITYSITAGNEEGNFIIDSQKGDI